MEERPQRVSALDFGILDNIPGGQESHLATTGTLPPDSRQTPLIPFCLQFAAGILHTAVPTRYIFSLTFHSLSPRPCIDLESNQVAPAWWRLSKLRSQSPSGNRCGSTLLHSVRSNVL